MKLILILASIFAITGCTTAAVAWESAATTEIKAANDNAVHIWMQAGCALPVGAVIRNATAVELVNKACGGGPAVLGQQGITVNVTLPQAAASAAK